jgi:serine/threonine protein phosphatase PrpC
MKIETKFSLQKRSEEAKVNQDAFAISSDERIFAIADGVSTAPFSQIWSNNVVKKFIEKPFASDLNEQKLKDWLEDIRKEWSSEIDQRKSPKMILERAKEVGGSTTFLGMIIQEMKKKYQKLQLFGIGDTNMFLIRNKRIKYSFPVTSVESFTDQTIGLCSIDNASQKIPELKEFNAKRGDIVILATDALAKWIFKYYKKGGEYSWKRILKNKNDIQNFIDKLRDAKKIDDDDTTCIIIKI